MKAPVSGVISRRGIEVGELAAPGTPVFTLVDLEELSIHLRAPGHDVIRLRPGMEARIVVEDDPALTLEGRIHRISPVADPQSNLFPVEVRLPNADGALKAGFHVAAQLTVASARDVLAVSERAVARREGQEGVYVVRDGRAVFIPVQFGITDGRAWREIVEAEGLREGDLIITIGKEYVIPGTPVRVQDLEDQGRRQ